MWQCRSCVCIVFGVPVALVFKVVWYVVCFTRAARTSCPCCFGPSLWCKSLVYPCLRYQSTGPFPQVYYQDLFQVQWSKPLVYWCAWLKSLEYQCPWSMSLQSPSRVYQWLVSPPDTKASAALVVVNHQASQGTQSNTATRGKKVKKKKKRNFL